MKGLTQNQREMLIQEAWEASKHSYSPYSHFAVGAALLGENGQVYRGCNIENVSYGLTNCAERTAIFKMVSEGCLHFTAIAVVADSVEITPPCGACRQVMAEFCADQNTPVLLSNGEKMVEETVKGLLPYTFISLETHETK